MRSVVIAKVNDCKLLRTESSEAVFMSPLGFYSVCLRATSLEKTVNFYKKLGFEPTGEDAPGLRVSLKYGNDSLTFMSFLNDNLINFRGAHIHNLKHSISKQGIKVKTFEELRGEERLMLDDRGNPLPENECGHFSVYDPDGHDLFFNTHPEERVPFEEAVLSSPSTRKDTISNNGLLGKLVYCLIVTDLRSSLTFYELLGLHVRREGQKAWIFSPDSHGNTQFIFQLEQGEKKDVVVRFYQNSMDSESLEGLGFKEHSSDGLSRRSYDPDGRVVEVVSTTNNSLLSSSGPT